MLADITFWHHLSYHQEYVHQSSSSPFDNAYYIKQNYQELLNFLREKKVRVSNSEIDIVLASNENSDVPSRLVNLIDDLGLSKAFAAKILSISRTSLYAWIKGETSAIRTRNLKKIEWLEVFSSKLPSDARSKVNLYKNRKLGVESTSLEELLVKANKNAEDVAQWLVSSIENTVKRPPFGSWKKQKTKGHISHIAEAYSDNA